MMTVDLTQYGVTAPITAPANFLSEAVPAFNARIDALKKSDATPTVSVKESAARAELIENVSDNARKIVDAVGKALAKVSENDALFVLQELETMLTPLRNASTFAIFEAMHKNDDDDEAVAEEPTDGTAAELEAWRNAIDFAWQATAMFGEQESLIEESKKIIAENAKIEDETKHTFVPVRFVEETKDGKKTGKTTPKPNIRNIPGELSGKKKSGRQADSFYVGYKIGDEVVPPKTPLVKLLARHLPTVSREEFDKEWTKQRATAKTGESFELHFGDTVVTVVHPTADETPAETPAE